MKKAMVLMAHCDDETLGAGGLMQKLVRNNWNVTVVWLSNGRVNVRGAVEDDNRNDAKRACQLLSVNNIKFFNYDDQKFDSYTIADMANSVASLGIDADLIITHSDRDLNLDHRIVCDLAKIIGRPNNKPCAILSCEIPTGSFWNGVPFNANYYVDIEHEIDTKIRAFSQYKNEIREYPHPWSEKGLRLLAEYHGMQAGYRYAEAFSVVRGYEGLP